MACLRRPGSAQKRCYATAETLPIASVGDGKLAASSWPVRRALAAAVPRSNGGVDDEPQQGRQPKDEQEAEEEFEATGKVHGGHYRGLWAKWLGAPRDRAEAPFCNSGEPVALTDLRSPTSLFRRNEDRRPWAVLP